MTTFNFNGMSYKVAASNNNYRILASGINGNSAIMSNIEIQQGLKNYGLAYGEFLSRVCGADAREFEISLDETHQYLISVDKDYYSREYVVCAWVIGHKYETIYEKKLGFKVMRDTNITATMFAMEIAVLACVADYEKRVADEEQERIDKEERERINKEEELMQECLNRYQAEFNGYAEDLYMVAEKYYGIDNRFTALICAEIVRKLEKVSKDYLLALGDITGCIMVEDDGWWIDTESLEKWADYPVGTDTFYLSDFEDLIDTLDYMSSSESDLPLGLEQDSIDWIVAGDGAACVGMQPDYTGETAYNFVMQNV